jgi:hypothetical protein
MSTTNPPPPPGPDSVKHTMVYKIMPPRNGVAETIVFADQAGHQYPLEADGNEYWFVMDT